MLSEDRRPATPKPRWWIADPAARHAFGKVRDVAWRTPTDEREALLLKASQMQHLVAVHVRRQMEENSAPDHPKRLSLPAVADRLESLNYDGLMRVLRGDVHMTLLHAADLSRVFGNLIMVSQDVTRRY